MHFFTFFIAGQLYRDMIYYHLPLKTIRCSICVTYNRFRYLNADISAAIIYKNRKRDT